MTNPAKLTIGSVASLVAVATLTACVVQQSSRSFSPVRSPSAVAALPSLPSPMYAYSDSSAPLPQHYLRGGPPGPPPGRGGPPPGRGFGPPPPPPPGGRGGPGGPGGRGGRGAPVASFDRTPTTNTTTDAGATLGRVLFYDKRLSANNTIACASCHQQAFGFADTARFSLGVNGERTARHSMSLANARFYRNGRYFWDERASSLEEQVLQPIQNKVEMGMSLDSLVPKIQSTNYYPALFTAAFGSPDVSSDRISRALAQFVRSLVSAQSQFDLAFANRAPPPNFGVLTAQQQEGQRIFATFGGCQVCHGTNAQVLDAPHNTGLDLQVTDSGAGGGRFKAPSLRNVAVRAPYMHDGRFKTLREVVEFYDHGVQPNPNLDQRMRRPDGAPRRLNLSPDQRDALVAYLESLTDATFLTTPKFSNPFTVAKVPVAASKSK